MNDKAFTFCVAGAAKLHADLSEAVRAKDLRKIAFLRSQLAQVSVLYMRKR